MKRGSAEVEGALICTICQFLCCKYFPIVDFKLPTCELACKVSRTSQLVFVSSYNSALHTTVLHALGAYNFVRHRQVNKSFAYNVESTVNWGGGRMFLALGECKECTLNLDMKTERKKKKSNCCGILDTKDLLFGNI